MVTCASCVSEQRETEYNSSQQNISFSKLQVKKTFLYTQILEVIGYHQRNNSATEGNSQCFGADDVASCYPAKIRYAEEFLFGVSNLKDLDDN